MEVTKGEDRSAEQAASLFGTQELESQRSNAGRGNRTKTRFKIIIGVLLLGLLVVILAAVLSVRKSNNQKEGVLWLQTTSEEIEQPQCPPSFSRPPLILVSLDGFRAEYLKDHRSHLSIINKLRNIGTTAPYIRPVYPTKTFPNHYSIVTGLYPESHGIVDNKMYDVTRDAFFSLKTDEKFNPKWYQGEPIWVTAMRQKLKTATFFWPGSDVAINGTFPNFYMKYDQNIPFENRLSALFEWLSLPQGERYPDFYTLYLDEPDTSGHHHGPGSSQVIQALENVDRIMGMLMDGLTVKDLHHCVNIIIVSDHGMEEASCERAEFVSNYQDHSSEFTVIQGPACRNPDQPMRPYLKENLPKRMHFANNVRIERGHLYMKSGWQAALNRKEIKYCSGGFHGSDNVFTNMQAIFIGFGPGFKENTVVPPFENIEIYNLMCDLLDIRPAPNNGTHGSLNHLLKTPIHMPVNPAQLSHESLCEATDPIPTDNLQCTCKSQTTAMVCANQILLAFWMAISASLRRLHHPFGTPRVVQSDATFCLLHHSDYLNGYSKDRLMPLWVSYTIPPLTRMQPLSPELEVCVRADIRVPPAASQLCLRYRDDPTLSYGLLHPPSEYLNASGPETDSLITSNMAPMFPAFKDVWTHFHDVLLPKYAQQLNGVNVMSGPIFDEDFDGNFVKHSFILPHRPDHTESCANGSDLTWVADWLQFHTARVRDIELLTGLSFYHDRLSVEETLQLKTFLQTA
uniref:Extracellular Endonuclease subunit A domain-containing protein n=1 Tax=Amphiprion ocellaris TaxID=80972 RepID=A0AAQ5WYY8_AMPOC